MKTVEKLCEELTQNKELSDALLEALKAGKVEDFLKAQDCPASREELKSCLHKMAAELPDEDLEQVDGGGTIVRAIQRAFNITFDFFDKLF